MITVKPIQNKEDQAALCRLCGIDFLPDALAYRAEDDQVFAGICQFGMDGDGGHLFHLAKAPDTAFDDALFVMGRAALNFIDLCGVHNADYRGDVRDERLLRRIGFRLTGDGRYIVDLNGFFDHPCAHAPN